MFLEKKKGDFTKNKKGFEQFLEGGVLRQYLTSKFKDARSVAGDVITSSRLYRLCQVL